MKQECTLYNFKGEEIFKGSRSEADDKFPEVDYICKDETGYWITIGRWQSVGTFPTLELALKSANKQTQKSKEARC